MQQNNTIETQEFFISSKNNVDITNDRKEILNSIVKLISNEIEIGNKVHLNFICTHNSRRSQLAQVWSHFAVHYFGLTDIKTFSGGTEVTAMHRNTVKTLQSVGFEFEILDFSHSNPVYKISFGSENNSIKAFSKLYNDKENTQPFIAITTCSSADENCPFIAEAIHRLHLPFVDPKISDNTEQMETKYLETNKEIAAEMFFVFQQLKS